MKTAIGAARAEQERREVALAERSGGRPSSPCTSGIPRLEFSRMKNMRGHTDGKGRARRAKIDPLGFAVIGQGYFSQAAVLPAFAGARECELRALFSEDATKLKALGRKYHVPNVLGYEQYDDFLRSGEVGAVYIALPNDMHRDFAIRAAQAGVHVLCEKPLAVTADEAQEIVDACAEHRVKLMVAYRLHFEEATLAAIDRVKRGDLGRARFFSSTFAMQVKDDNIRTRRARGGGPLLDLGIYASTPRGRCSPPSRSGGRDQRIERERSALLRGR